MNNSMIRYILSRVLELEGIFLLLPAVVGFFYGEREGFAYLAVAAGCLLIGFVGKLFRPKSKVFYAREGYVAVSLSWLLLSLAGAVPFWLTGEIPSYADALFETVSGFTTTGGTVLADVESLSRCSQFFRLFTHWIGGVGVLVLILAILPLSGSYNMHLMRAESTGPSVGKLVPKIRNTARILYEIYIVFTVAEVLLLLLAGLPLYDALTLTFSTVGTGGYGLLNSSAASYSVAVQVILMLFMLLCGISFQIYYLFLVRKPGEALRNEELRGYLLVILLVTLGIGFGIRDCFSNIWEALYQALFHTISVITTTGFSICDFNQWPAFPKMLLFLLMFTGACAGSTGGGLKISRLIVWLKSIRNEVLSVVHPHSVKQVHLDGRALSKEVLHSIHMYLVLYVCLYLVSVILISVDDFSFETNVSAVMTAIGNVGPGFDMVGPAGNFGAYSVFSKCVLMFDMLAGRLEFLPIMVVFSARTWKK